MDKKRDLNRLKREASEIDRLLPLCSDEQVVAEAKRRGYSIKRAVGSAVAGKIHSEGQLQLSLSGIGGSQSKEPILLPSMTATR